MRPRATRWWTIACALLAFLMFPTAGLASSSYKTGLYKGKTSQGFPFEFALKNIACPNKRHLCLYTAASTTAAEANIDETCPGTTGTTNAYVDLALAPVPKSGVVHFTSTAFSVVTATIKIHHNGTMSGTFAATGVAGGSSAGCSSGPVAFTASRV
jgi:hypothetical protein